MGAHGAPPSVDPLYGNDDSDEKKSFNDVFDQLNYTAMRIAAKNRGNNGPFDKPLDVLRKEKKSFYDSPAFCIPLGLANPACYMGRHLWYTGVLLSICAYFIGSFLLFEPNGLMKYLIMLPIIWYYADAYGGILHIVLDTPTNIGYPIIGLPSLEFQLHHAIPQDIVLKGFANACGDLNVIGTWSFICAILSGADKYVMTVGCTILLASYCGQASHQATHKVPSHNGPLVKFLQRTGIFLDPKIHRGHHQTHDKDFCILCGWASPGLQFLLRFVDQQKAAPAWIALFFWMTAFGAATLARALEHGLMVLGI